MSARSKYCARSAAACATTVKRKGAAILAKIYGWFAEGFETADLKDPKELLDELNE